ncbi:RagB/SusD family protein [Arcticibacter sp.]|uniref:RagB/SusD family protein n=1 Tax=Arcticibacter sp. TaxID=1872630 RepID=UPI0038910E96
MKKKLYKLYALCLGALISFAPVSCKKMLDVEPGEVLGEEQMFQNVYDADAAVVGIYGKFLGLAEQYIVLNELRGDLADVTVNSDKHLNELHLHQVRLGNPYADPRPFYEVILYCNDVLKNFNVMLASGKLQKQEYDTRFSDVGALRSWLYLQLGIHFGEVPYVTEPIENINDLKDPAKFPKLSFDQLLDNLLSFTEALPFKEDYPAGTTLLTTVDSYNTTKFFINKKLVLGDLHLWKGNYRQAASYYRDIMELSATIYSTTADQYFEVNRVTYSSQLAGANWIKIFNEPYGERYSNYDNIWLLPFDKSFSPSNPFIEKFANTGTGKYQIKPSQFAIGNWNKQMRGNTPYDLRGTNASWKMSNRQPVINKQIPNYSSTLPFETNGKWILYRASALHLRFAEAANRDNRQKLAYALLNNGIKNAFDPTPGVANRDVTGIMNTLNDPAPYNFDAREGEYPRFRGPWYRASGIRSRAQVNHSTISAADSVKYFDMSNPDPYYRDIIDSQGLTLLMEDKLIDEGGLELAFEGYRWPDLLRIALRREKESPGTGVAFLQARVNAKFSLSEGGFPNLGNKMNWFLPFNWE